MYESFLCVDNEDSNQPKLMRTMSESSCDAQSYVNCKMSIHCVYDACSRKDHKCHFSCQKVS